MAGDTAAASVEVDSIVTVRAEKWVQQGFCLGYLDVHSPESSPDLRSSSGFPIFLHGAIPGEEVRVRITRANNRHCFGLVEEVLQPSEQRLASDCSAFPRCGGCSFRHIDYTAEVELKLRLLDELKSLQACIQLAKKSDQFQVHSAEPDGYRTRARLHRASRTDWPGFYGLHSNQIVPVPADTGCRQLSPDLNDAILEEIQQLPAPAAGSDRTSQESVTRDQAHAKRARSNPRRESNPRHHALQLELDDPIPVDGSPWFVPQGAFFQANQYLLKDWLQAVRRLLENQQGQQQSAKPPATIELFSGSGLLGGSVRDLLGDYIGYDNAPPGLKAARDNFKHRKYTGNFENTDLYRRPVPIPTGTGLALINPPRAGMNIRQIPLLADAQVPTILYSSCNPVTLNRDLEHFLERGYQARSVEIFDFFPRTPHLEILILLEKHA